jgi:dGTPase
MPREHPSGPVAESFHARLDAVERVALGPLAVRSADTQGRLHDDAEADDACSLRSPFQRDRDRIVHCKAFRRLKHKTQVFISPEGDHFRTRLTHTIETTGISRTVARALRLNEDLTEAIGLGHDLGHPPFGHAGEDALDGALQERFGLRFRHNEHSLRVVDRLERDGRGLNLTHEVRDGILHHTRETPPASLEGRIVRIVDRVAYINHDIDDALRAGVLRESDLPAGPIGLLGDTGSRRIDALVHDLVEQSAVAGDIVQSAELGGAMLELRAFLFANLYTQGRLRHETDRAAFVVRTLFGHACDALAATGLEGRALADAVVDDIAGMTDRYAVRRFRELCEPRAWSL